MYTYYVHTLYVHCILCTCICWKLLSTCIHVTTCIRVLTSSYRAVHACLSCDCQVTYDIDGFLEKNRDSLPDMVAEALRVSSLRLLGTLFSPRSGGGGGGGGGGRGDQLRKSFLRKR